MKVKNEKILHQSFANSLL
jgi:hypothetical protein